MTTEKRKKAALRLREAATYLVTEGTAILRMLDEADAEERDEIPTVRPPSTPAMQAVHVPRVEVVRFPEKGR